MKKTKNLKGRLDLKVEATAAKIAPAKVLNKVNFLLHNPSDDEEEGDLEYQQYLVNQEIVKNKKDVKNLEKIKKSNKSSTPKVEVVKAPRRRLFKRKVKTMTILDEHSRSVDLNVADIEKMRAKYMKNSENRHTDDHNLKGADKRKKNQKKIDKKEKKITNNGKRNVSMIKNTLPLIESQQWELLQYDN